MVYVAFAILVEFQGYSVTLSQYCASGCAAVLRRCCVRNRFRRRQRRPRQEDTTRKSLARLPAVRRVQEEGKNVIRIL